MKIRGIEEVWCEGPGWYFWFPNYAMPEGRDYAGPFESQWVTICALRDDGFDGAEVFQITQADIEAES